MLPRAGGGDDEEDWGLGLLAHRNHATGEGVVISFGERQGGNAEVFSPLSFSLLSLL